MISFNSSSLRYQFIYLTQDVFNGIAVNSLLEITQQEKHFQDVVGNGIQFHLIEKYIDFTPFSLRFVDIYNIKGEYVANRTTYPVKTNDSKYIMFTNILFFVDMYNPNMTSFLYIPVSDSTLLIRKRISCFLDHCLAMVRNDKESLNRNLCFTLREQQIVFYLLGGRTIKEISQHLGVSDKLVYRIRDNLSDKLRIQHQTGLKG